MAVPEGKGSDLAAAVGPCWSEAKTAAALAVSVESLAALRTAGGVLGLETADGVWVYPIDQFRTGGGRVEVKPDLLPVFHALRGHDPWAVAVLLHTPAPELGGATPLDLLTVGRDLEVLACWASVVNREWSAGSVGR